MLKMYFHNQVVVILELYKYFLNKVSIISSRLRVYLCVHVCNSVEES